MFKRQDVETKVNEEIEDYESNEDIKETNIVEEKIKLPKYFLNKISHE
jgi:hypothetical protein